MYVCMQQGKAWMRQLLSVSCLSLAAKMEDTDVSLLLDLQVSVFMRFSLFSWFFVRFFYFCFTFGDRL